MARTGKNKKRQNKKPKSDRASRALSREQKKDEESKINEPKPSEQLPSQPKPGIKDGLIHRRETEHSSSNNEENKQEEEKEGSKKDTTESKQMTETELKNNSPTENPKEVESETKQNEEDSAKPPLDDNIKEIPGPKDKPVVDGTTVNVNDGVESSQKNEEESEIVDTPAGRDANVVQKPPPDETDNGDEEIVAGKSSLIDNVEGSNANNNESESGMTEQKPKEDEGSSDNHSKGENNDDESEKRNSEEETNENTGVVMKTSLIGAAPNPFSSSDESSKPNSTNVTPEVEETKDIEAAQNLLTLSTTKDSGTSSSEEEGVSNPESDDGSYNLRFTPNSPSSDDSEPLLDIDNKEKKDLKETRAKMKAAIEKKKREEEKAKSKKNNKRKHRMILTTDEEDSDESVVEDRTNKKGRREKNRKGSSGSGRRQGRESDIHAETAPEIKSFEDLPPSSFKNYDIEQLRGPITDYFHECHLSLTTELKGKFWIENMNTVQIETVCKGLFKKNLEFYFDNGENSIDDDTSAGGSIGQFLGDDPTRKAFAESIKLDDLPADQDDKRDFASCLSTLMNIHMFEEQEDKVNGAGILATLNNVAYPEDNFILVQVAMNKTSYFWYGTKNRSIIKVPSKNICSITKLASKFLKEVFNSEGDKAGIDNVMNDDESRIAAVLSIVEKDNETTGKKEHIVTILAVAVFRYVICNEDDASDKGRTIKVR